MEELLISKGWKYISGCNCGGVNQRKYWNPAFPAFKIAVMPARNICIVMQYNVRFVPDNIAPENLENTLKTLGLWES